MRIANNISALNTHRTLINSDTQMSKSMERLSSGYRINKAADDAAGLAISEKMRAQVRGLNQASRNAQDGISMIQTAEGGLNEMHSILQRMRELAVQAGNDTLTSSDKGEIQKEVDQLVSEIDRISDDTEFNTKKLLNGQAGVLSTAQNGVNNNASSGITVGGVAVASGAVVTAAAMTDAFEVNVGSDTQAGVYSVTVTSTATQAQIGDAKAFTAGNSGALTLNGVNIDIVAGDTLATVMSKINNVTLQTGIVASSGTTNSGLVLKSSEYGSDQTISIQSTAGAAGILDDMGLAVAPTATVLTDAGEDAVGTINGQVAIGEGNKLTLSKDGNAADDLSIDIKSLDLKGTAGGITFSAAVDPNGQVSLQIGANSNQNLTFSISDMGTSSLGIDNLDVTTDPDAALNAIDDALDAVSSERSKLGAYQNRLEHTISNLGVSAENITASESRIRDIDMAKEMSEFTKNQILTQASTSMLAQANQKSQSVLKLLG